MSRPITLAILSDIHYASAAERARGEDYELRSVGSALGRGALRTYRNWFWLRNPMQQNHLLDQFLERAASADFVVANGDYSCDSGFIGVADDAARQSAAECLGKLRAKFGTRFRATYGDHELGKINFAGASGGMRLASLHAARESLDLPPFWKTEVGGCTLIGVTSSIIAFPVYEMEALPEERAEWWRLREAHLQEIRAAFSALKAGERVLLFCHDPTALPFLAREKEIAAKLPHIAQTIIGHLHSNLILWKGRALAGMPVIKFLGNSVKRMSTALNEARVWKEFHVKLCPALPGIELLKDGGYLTAELPPDAPPRFQFHRLPR